MNSHIDTQLVQRAMPRTCVSRRIYTFSRAEVMDRLYREDETQSDFRIVSQVAFPTLESSFDVCRDDEYLYVSVLSWDTSLLPGSASLEDSGKGLAQNVVEVIFSPYDDEIGYLQFGAGPSVQTWFNHHWPYHDGQADLTHRPHWQVDVQSQVMGETIARFAFFRFSLDLVPGVETCPAVGFNVMRTHFGLAESATWSYTSGSGFTDATGMGQLQLKSSSAISSRDFQTPEPKPSVVLHATYDFPDELFNAPYSPQTLQTEFKALKKAGVRRLYWIDYPFLERGLGQEDFGGGVPSSFAMSCAQKTLDAFGGDVLAVAAKLAHELDLEFYVTIKPYDLWCRGTKPFDDQQSSHFPRTLSGYATTPDPFVAAHPEFSFRRNPQWSLQVVSGPLTKLTLFLDHDGPLVFDHQQIKLLCSNDNVTYEVCEKVDIQQDVIKRPRYQITPAGKRPLAGEESVRCITFTNLNINAPFWAVQLPTFSEGSLGNKPDLWVEVESQQNDLPVTLSSTLRQPDFRQGGFEFGGHTNNAAWQDYSEAFRMQRILSSGEVLGIAIGQDAYLMGMLDPGFPQVRDYWLTHYVQRAIDAGADGVDVRIAHHHGCPNWLAYAWAQPVLDAFVKQTGRSPQLQAEDYELARRLRGQFHTQFLRDAKALLSASGCKLEHHIEGRMTTSPKHDTYTQIHWDYATWIDEGIIDGINLKYLQPFNPWVQRKILPRAHKQGISVHVISAIGDPRSQPRTPQWTVEMLDMVQAGGLDALNLYEVWVYLRNTEQGHPVMRGCTRAIFEQLSKHLQTNA